MAVGLSLGARPAAHLATERPIAGLILGTPLDSLTALAREHYPWLPVGLLLRHRIEVAEALAKSSVPVALISAERDTVVSPRRTEAVRRSARNLLLDQVIHDAGHNDLYDRPEFKQAMGQAPTLLEGTPGKHDRSFPAEPQARIARTLMSAGRPAKSNLDRSRPSDGQVREVR